MRALWLGNHYGPVRAASRKYDPVNLALVAWMPAHGWCVIWVGPTQAGFTSPTLGTRSVQGSSGSWQ